MEMKAVKLRVARVEDKLGILQRQMELLKEFLVNWEGGVALSRKLEGIKKGGDDSAG